MKEQTSLHGAEYITSGVGAGLLTLSGVLITEPSPVKKAIAGVAFFAGNFLVWGNARHVSEFAPIALFVRKHDPQLGIIASLSDPDRSTLGIIKQNGQPLTVEELRPQVELEVNEGRLPSFGYRPILNGTIKSSVSRLQELGYLEDIPHPIQRGLAAEPTYEEISAYGLTENGNVLAERIVDIFTHKPTQLQNE